MKSMEHQPSPSRSSNITINSCLLFISAFCELVFNSGCASKAEVKDQATAQATQLSQSYLAGLNVKAISSSQVRGAACVAPSTDRNGTSRAFHATDTNWAGSSGTREHVRF